jgi:hypothetical protein
MEQKQIFNWILLFAGVGALYKVSQKLGLIKSSAETSVDTSEISETWDYSKPTPKGARLLTANSGSLLSEKIYNAHHWYNDNEEEVYSVFRALSSQSQVTSLAYWFKQKYNEDLFYYLKSFLSDNEMAVIVKIINSKPKI